METHLHADFATTEAGRKAEAILRSCVHCGFCTATCPTYQLLGDELDGPRGRIYLIKQLLEKGEASAQTRLHLDRCLLCRACETTCPSGVRYSQLLHIGKEFLARELPLKVPERLLRKTLLTLLPYPKRLKPLLKMAQSASRLLPKEVRKQIAPGSASLPRPAETQARRILLFRGCVQSATHPGINDAAARVLQRLGIQATEVAGEQCCGAVHHHLQKKKQALHFARTNLDLWLPLIEEGAEALLFTASACALEVKEYPLLFEHHDPYHAKARKLADKCLDLGEFLEREPLERIVSKQKVSISFHSPCTLQHGLRRKGSVEEILTRLGLEVHEPEDAHLCCGSAGTYSLLQPRIARRLGRNKAEKLEQAGGSLIATANIGCLMHLTRHANLPVKHWIEIVEELSRPEKD